jgi:hypothetical protein
MTTALSIILLVVGMAIVVNSVSTARSGTQEFPRHREPVSTSRRFLPALLGVIIAVCGGGILLFTRLG